jgi:histidine ammonia-lyase
MAAQALDDLAAIWADLCLLCHRHGARLLDARASELPDLLVLNRSPSDSDGHGSVG